MKAPEILRAIEESARISSGQPGLRSVALSTGCYDDVRGFLAESAARCEEQRRRAADARAARSQALRSMAREYAGMVVPHHPQLATRHLVRRIQTLHRKETELARRAGTPLAKLPGREILTEAVNEKKRLF